MLCEMLVMVGGFLGRSDAWIEGLEALWRCGFYSMLSYFQVSLEFLKACSDVFSVWSLPTRLIYFLPQEILRA